MSVQPLIIRLPNWVGDVIMALPSLTALHEAGFKLELYGKKWILDLLHAFPAELHVLPDSLFLAKKQLHQNQTTQALLLTNSFSSALTMRLAGKKPIGYRTDGRACLLTKKLAKTPGLHEVEHFWHLAQFASQTWQSDFQWPTSIPPKIRLPIHSSYLNKIDALLQQEGIQSPFIVLCPNATGKNKANQLKIWPHWAALSNYLAENRIPAVCAPGPGEETTTQALLPKTQQILNLSLAELTALFIRAQLVLANDTGPMHIASATETQVLGLFGTTPPERTRPWGGQYLGQLGKWPSLQEVINELNKNI